MDLPAAWAAGPGVFSSRGLRRASGIVACHWSVEGSCLAGDFKETWILTRSPGEADAEESCKVWADKPDW